MEKTKGYWWPISRPRDIYSWLYHVLSHVIPLSSCHMLSYPMNYVPIPFPSDPILSHYVSIKSHQKFHSIPVNPMKSHIISYIWVNYNISLTWINAIWGWFPLSTMIPVRSQWGRYNLPRYINPMKSHIISYHIIIISYIISYHIMLYHIISYIIYHIISYHIIYHISYIIYHIISYHIISYIYIYIYHQNPHLCAAESDI